MVFKGIFSIAVFALLVLAAIASAQLDDVCNDQNLKFGVNPDDCSRYFMCMLGQRVDFQCDQDFIFDADLRRCRLGSRETCEFRFGVCDFFVLIFKISLYKFFNI